MAICWLGSPATAGVFCGEWPPEDAPQLTAWGLLLAAVGFSGLWVHSRWAKRHAADEVEKRNQRFAALATSPAPPIDFSGHPQAALRALDDWDALSDADREQVGRWLADQLPDGWRFSALRCCELADQRHTVAFFAWHEAEFALIPGGSVRLGYDAARPFVPTSAQLESWRNCDALREELDDRLRTQLEEYLLAALTPLREVCLEPLLLETEARNYERLEDLEALYAAGFRPPTSDEWEHACGAGARTLFRWGDDCPTDRIPRTSARPTAGACTPCPMPWDWSSRTTLGKRKCAPSRV